MRKKRELDLKEKAWQGRMGGLDQSVDPKLKKNTQLPPITLDAESSMVNIYNSFFHSLFILIFIYLYS